MLAILALSTLSVGHFAHENLASRRSGFEILLKQQWEYTMEQAPEFASTLGDFRYNDRWSDPSPTNQRKMYRDSLHFLKRFKGVDSTGFSEQEKISLQMMIESLKDGVEGYELKLWEMPFDPFNGIQISMPTAVPSFDFSTKKHYEDYLKRLRALPLFMHRMIEVARLGITDRMVPLDSFTPTMVGQARKILEAKGDANPFVSPALKFPASFSATEKKRLHRKLLAAVDQSVVPAYREVVAFLAGPLAKASRHQPGIWSLPNGERCYRYNLRTLTTTDRTPDEVHRLGLEQVKADTDAENKLAQAQGFADRKAYLAALRADPKEHFHSAEEVLQRFRDDYRSIEPKLPQYFKNLPKQPLGVFPVEKYREATMDIAEYQTGSPDGKRPGRVVVTPFGWERRVKAFEDTTAYHEGEPGHHLQLSTAMSIKSLPNFRKYGFYSAFEEGWALYSEGLADEMGMYESPASKFGQLDADMLRACRLVVDSGVHAKHWTRKQMIDYLLANYITGSRHEIEAACDRYIAWPGQACAYKSGQLEILQLRSEAEKALGSKFDIREFHDWVLGHGSVPLYVLKDQIHEHIKQASDAP